MDEFVCDAKKWPKHTRDLLATKQMVMILNGMLIPPKMWKEYFKWVFQYLFCSWNTDPELRTMVTQKVIKCVRDLDTANDKIAVEEKENWIKLQKAYIRSFILSMPPRFVKSVFDNRAGKPWLMSLGIPYRYIYRISSIRAGDTFRYSGEVALDHNAILMGEQTAIEDAFCWVMQSPRERGEELLSYFSDAAISNVEMPSRYPLAQFFGNLAWYLPFDVQYLAQERKCTVSLVKASPS